MRQNYQLSCESTVDMPFSYVDGRGLSVLFYSYTVDGVEYVDDMGRDSQALPRFYQFIADGKVPKTSQVNTYTYCEYFRALLAKGDVFHIAFGSGIEHVNPKLLVQDFAGEDEYAHLRIHLLGLTAYLDADSRGAAQSEVEQHEVGLLLFDESPEGSLVLSRADDFRFWYLVTYDAFCTFQFEGYVLNDN